MSGGDPAARRYALVGPRAAGKTTLGRALADALDLEFVDTDVTLARELGHPDAGSALAALGEPRFREVEAAICCRFLAPGATAMPRVVSLGGGAVLSAATRALLREPGLWVVAVTAPVSVLVERIESAGPRRPALTALPVADEVRHLLEARARHYSEVSDMEIDTSFTSVDATVARIRGVSG